VTHAQAARAALRFSAHPQKWRVLVAHHPFVVPVGRESDRVEGADAALPILEAAGVDLILTGHLHVASVAGRNEAHTMLAVQAGTCMSTRLRGEPNGYNHLRFDDDVLTVVQRVWDGGRFVDGDVKSYRRRGAVGEAERFVKIGELAGATAAVVPRS
jgi:3',5'-cyclic AMP phosphodiesterase CpdA